MLLQVGSKMELFVAAANVTRKCCTRSKVAHGGSHGGSHGGRGSLSLTVACRWRRPPENVELLDELD